MQSRTRKYRLQYSYRHIAIRSCATQLDQSSSLCLSFSHDIVQASPSKISSLLWLPFTQRPEITESVELSPITFQLRHQHATTNTSSMSLQMTRLRPTLPTM